MKEVAIHQHLFRHMEWADAVVWRGVIQSSEAAGDERLRKLLYHIHLTQYSFLNIWRSRDVQYPGFASFADLRAICGWGRDYYHELKRFLGSVTAASLEEPVILPWAVRILERIGAEPVTPTLGQTLLQVASHSTYHRGQVNARLREVGAEPPLTDYIAWIWLGQPAAEWSPQ